MLHYKTPNGTIRAVGEAGDIDGDQSFLVQESWTLLTDAELNPPLTLEQVQEAQIRVITTSYNDAIAQDIGYMSTIFQADSNSLMLMTQVLVVGSVPSSFYWRDKNNNNIPMTFAELHGLANAIQIRGLEYFTKLQTLKDSINFAKDIKSVKNIVW